MRVAIVHDWMVGGGAERVVEQLHKMFPEAPIYTSYCSDEWRQKLGPSMVRTGYLQNWPFSKLRKFTPFLRIWWFGRLNFDNYDLVISSSGAEAKGIKTKKPTVHINYCHSPTHYYWSRYNEYLEHPGFGVFNPLARLGLKLLVGPLRRWDKKAAQRPDYMIANSRHTQSEIKKYYGRESTVVHPPVDVERFKPTEDLPRHGFLIAGRQTPYKRVDLAVAACTKLGLQLKVIGDGPDHKRLMKLAGPTIQFLGHIPDNKRPGHFQQAEAFIFPGLDDFGIVAIEALAAGTPVIAYGKGGALDYVNQKTGLLFQDQSIDSLTKALQEFSKKTFDYFEAVSQASRFAPKNFQEAFVSFLDAISIMR